MSLFHGLFRFYLKLIHVIAQWYNFKNTLRYLHNLCHLQWIPVYKYSWKNRHCCCNQRFHHRERIPQSTHRYLMLRKREKNGVLHSLRSTAIKQVDYIDGENNKTLNTFTKCSISSESLFTSTAVRTVSVGAISVFITGNGFRRTLIDV